MTNYTASRGGESPWQVNGVLSLERSLRHLPCLGIPEVAALQKNTPNLTFDELTANTDSQTEKQVLGTLFEESAE